MTDADASLPAELLQRARNGDAAARDELFAKCRNFVGFVARTQVESWLQAKVDASDLVQQTMLEAHRGFDNFRGQTEQEWLAWLRQILAHNAADFVRRYRGTEKRQARREVPMAALGGRSSVAMFDPSDPGASPSELAIGRERELLVADALARLPADYQEVIALRNLQRLPFEEVAQRMGRSGPAVQMLWLRAIRRLQKDLHAESADGEPADD